ncbi:MAG: helix-turn-helix domain-containing protein [Balneolaceae bacterium]
MIKDFRNTKLDSHLIFTDENLFSKGESISGEYYKILLNRSDALSVCVDGLLMDIAKNHILCLTPLQKVSLHSATYHFVMLLFNREFYCIHENDEEVSCNGLLFFGSSEVPVLTLDKDEQKKFNDLLNVFQDEMDTIDKIQGEMLRMLLKRLIIKCTRLAKKQFISPGTDDYERDIIRKFNILVEKNYKKYRQVSDYAKLLNKAPKTLSNIFSAANHKSPLKVIHNRLLTEAKRYLLFSDMILKEIAYELGFETQAHFSRFFKNETGYSPSEFRRTHPESIFGKN